MNRKLTVFLEGGCSAVLAASKYVAKSCNLHSHTEIYHDFASCTMGIKDEVEDMLKNSLSTMHIPVYKAHKVHGVYNKGREENLRYWMINPDNDPIGSLYKCDDYSITIALMCDSNRVLTICAVPTEDKIYFDYPDRGVYVIERCSEIESDITVTLLSTVARSLSTDVADSEPLADLPDTHFWFG
ncbi:MAG: hypothetical protein SNH41_05145 [Rikenellaceae bacterium]